MVDTIVVKNIYYDVGSEPVNGTFVYTDDTVSTLFQVDKNIPKECGDHVVICQVVPDKKPTFFDFKLNVTDNSSTYSYGIYSNSSSDVGVWKV